MEYIATFNEYLWTLFQGTVQAWNDWLVWLETQADRKTQERALVPTEEGAYPFLPIAPHAPFREYQEATFPFNLPANSTLILTEDKDADEWIRHFATFQIDIYNMILRDNTLPDPIFLRKRYLILQRKVHPDRGGTNDESKEVNVAKDELDKLYEDSHEQINLFQAVFTSYDQRQDQQSKKRKLADSTSVTSSSNTTSGTESSAPYIVLFLVGASAGWIVVFRRHKVKKR